MNRREIKQKVHDLLGARQLDMQAIRAQLQLLPAKELVNALFAFICREDPLVRWRSISAMGQAVATLATEDLEEGRIIMRRFLWSLNDESGGIGWGVPESMAETMCRHEVLAQEYHHMLASYVLEDGGEIWQDGNFVEHPLLQEGVLWGIARMSQCHPALMRSHRLSQALIQFMSNDAPQIRGLALLAAMALHEEACHDSMEKLLEDEEVVRIYEDGIVRKECIAHLAARGLQEINR